MGRFILVFIMVLLTAAILFSLVFSMYSGMRLVPRLSNATKDMGRFQETRHTFEVTKVRYSYGANFSSVCETNLTHLPLVVEVLFSGTIPERCEAYIDNNLAKKIAVHAPPGEESFIDLIDIKGQNVHVSHKMELCCDDICVSRKIEKEC
jgi:hypothetical protein